MNRLPVLALAFLPLAVPVPSAFADGGPVPVSFPAPVVESFDSLPATITSA